MGSAMVQPSVDADGAAYNDIYDHILRLCNQAVDLAEAYSIADNAESINEAIGIMEQAAEMVPQGHIRRASVSGNLLAILELRFERTGSMDDLDQIINLAGQELEGMPQNHPDRAAWLDNLGSCLKMRFK